MTADILHKDWALFKKALNISLAAGNMEESYRLLELICQFGYTYNFLEQFKDDEVEKKLYEFTVQMNKQAEFKPAVFEKMGKVIFYDFFTQDFRGFTQQYINYFIKNGIEFLYIMCDHNYVEKNQIIQSIISYTKGSIFIIDTKLGTITTRLKAVFEKAGEYKADKIFVHNAPWDIFSYCLGILLKKYEIKSYLINITDHAFWLGTTIFDYVIDFRRYGAQLNQYYRQIPSDKILIINTAAYIDDSIAFKGFPVSVENKVVGFGGGAVYKIKDEENTFLNLIKSLLLQNDNFVFFFANVGDTDYVKNFIAENKLQHRLIAIGNREDICAIFQHINIFFNTYPYGGGNMLSYAFQNILPVVTLYDKKFTHTRLDLIFDIDLESKYILVDQKDYIDYANKLITSADYRKEISDVFAVEMDKRISFDEGLKTLLNNNETCLIPASLQKIEINNESALHFHLNKNQFQPAAYFGLKSSILRNHFLLELKNGWKKKIYWKNSFPLNVKLRLKKYFPFLTKFKNIVHG